MGIFKRIADIAKSNINDMFKSDFDILMDEQLKELQDQFSKKIDDYAKKDFDFGTQPKETITEIKYYLLLDIPSNSNFDTIKKAYRKKMKENHPDKFNNNPDKYNEAIEKSSKLNEAYAYFEVKFNK